MFELLPFSNAEIFFTFPSSCCLEPVPILIIEPQL
ncbi:hypothetical protein VPHK58G2_0012 [Vibrio phage K58 g2]